MLGGLAASTRETFSKDRQSSLLKLLDHAKAFSKVKMGIKSMKSTIPCGHLQAKLLNVQKNL